MEARKSRSLSHQLVAVAFTSEDVDEFVQCVDKSSTSNKAAHVHEAVCALLDDCDEDEVRALHWGLLGIGTILQSQLQVLNVLCYSAPCWHAWCLRGLRSQIKFALDAMEALCFDPEAQRQVVAPNFKL